MLENRDYTIILARKTNNLAMSTSRLEKQWEIAQKSLITFRDA